MKFSHPASQEISYAFIFRNTVIQYLVHKHHHWTLSSGRWFPVSWGFILISSFMFHSVLSLEIFWLKLYMRFSFPPVCCTIVWDLVWARDFSLLQSIKTGCEAHPASCLICARGCFPAVTRLRHDVGHSPPSDRSGVAYSTVFVYTTCTEGAWGSVVVKTLRY